MGKIIAIGGGYNGGDFDKDLEGEIRNFVKKSNPTVVFIPYASNDFEENYQEFQRIYHKMGCQVSLLQPGKESLLLQADIIYLGRGTTIPLLSKLAETGAIPILLEASANGVVIAGFSAGAHALSASAGSYEENLGYTLVDGIGMIKGSIMTHYNYAERAEAYDKLLKVRNLEGIGLEDHTMLVVEDNLATIFSSKVNYNGYLINTIVSHSPVQLKTGEKINLPL